MCNFLNYVQDAFGLVEEDSGMPPKKRVKMEAVEPLESSPDNKEVTHLNDSTVVPLTHDCDVIFKTSETDEL